MRYMITYAVIQDIFLYDSFSIKAIRTAISDFSPPRFVAMKHEAGENVAVLYSCTITEGERNELRTSPIGVDEYYDYEGLMKDDGFTFS